MSRALFFRNLRFAMAPLAAVAFLTSAALPAEAALPASLPGAVGETPVPSLSPMIKRVSPAV